MTRKSISRRAILLSSGAAIIGFNLLPHRTYAGMLLDHSNIDEFITARLERDQIPGLAACIIKNDSIIWSKGYGWANIKQTVGMNPEITVQNIASVSKTITATAVMQLWEQGKFRLDDDINEFLPFEVRNPSYPKKSITFRQLLIQRSSIKDGSAYRQSYTCGDPALSLETWLREYFTPGGKFNSRENFHWWKPGEQGVVPQRPRNYSNVGFGVLGYLVEILSGTTFENYCQDNIFAPLSMGHTSWHLAGLNTSYHAIPYKYVSDGKIEGTLLRQDGVSEGKLNQGGYFPHCLYSFPNYPDGLARTSVNQLARFLMSYMNYGAYGNQQILQKDTVRKMLRPQVNSATYQGLCWNSMQLANDELVWGHFGRDPGVGAGMFFRPTDRVGVIVFVNTSGVNLEEIVNRLFSSSTNQ